MSMIDLFAESSDFNFEVQETTESIMHSADIEQIQAFHEHELAISNLDTRLILSEAIALRNDPQGYLNESEEKKESTLSRWWETIKAFFKGLWDKIINIFKKREQAIEEKMESVEEWKNANETALKRAPTISFKMDGKEAFIKPEDSKKGFKTLSDAINELSKMSYDKIVDELVSSASVNSKATDAQKKKEQQTLLGKAVQKAFNGKLPLTSSKGSTGVFDLSKYIKILFKERQGVKVSVDGSNIVKSIDEVLMSKDKVSSMTRELENKRKESEKALDRAYNRVDDMKDGAAKTNKKTQLTAASSAIKELVSLLNQLFGHYVTLISEYLSYLKAAGEKLLAGGDKKEKKEENTNESFSFF